MGVSCEEFGENWPRYNDTMLYFCNGNSIYVPVAVDTLCSEVPGKYMMRLWHETTARITGPLWGESTGNCDQ